MTIANPGGGVLDYEPVQYGQSKLLFRGPCVPLGGDYCAFVGGTETYGKYVAAPFPALLDRGETRPVVNFGCQNAGIDLFLNEPTILEVCNGARVTVLQVPGAQNMSNRFYSVHPRRNDRFLRPSTLMKALFDGIDFDNVYFTRHLLLTLQRDAPDKFPLLVGELKQAWVARMKILLQSFHCPTVLLWLGDCRATMAEPDGLGPAPVLVDDNMVAAVAPLATEMVRVTPSRAAREAGVSGMIFPDMDLAMAAQIPGPLVHEEIAAALDPVLARYMQ